MPEKRFESAQRQEVETSFWGYEQSKWPASVNWWQVPQKQEVSYLNHLKIIEMNCEELIRKMNNKDGDVEMLNELIYENESNTIEMLNQSEIFFKLNEQIWSPLAGDKQGWG